MPEEMNKKHSLLSNRKLSTADFLNIADSFIDVANKHNLTIEATDLHMAFLFGAARYNAHVAKNVLHIEDYEDFTNKMVQTYGAMLKDHLADSNN